MPESHSEECGDLSERFRELWEKAADPLTEEQMVEEANKELQRIQEQFWKRREERTNSLR